MIFFFFLLVLSYFVIRPFVTIILTSAVIAYVVYPIYKYLQRKTRMQTVPALLCLLLILLVVAIPILFVASQVVDEAYGVYTRLRGNVNDGGVLEGCENQDNYICNHYVSLQESTSKYGIDLPAFMRQGLQALATKAISFTTGLILSLPTVLFKMFVMFFLIFFMLIDGHYAMEKLRNALPLNKIHSKNVFKTFDDLIFATIYGAILLSMIQGILAGFGFLIFGVSSPFLWGVLSIIAAFIPFVGAAIIWVPLVLKMVLEGLILGDNTLLLMAAGLALYCIVIVGTVDNILKPKIIGDKAGLHPVIVLLGVFGGLSLFGFAGIIIGPLLLALFIALLRIYEVEKDSF